MEETMNNVAEDTLKDVATDLINDVAEHVPDVTVTTINPSKISVTKSIAAGSLGALAIIVIVEGGKRIVRRKRRKYATPKSEHDEVVGECEYSEVKDDDSKETPNKE